MKIFFKFVLGLVVGFVLGGLLFYGNLVYQSYIIERNTEEAYLEDECYQYYYSLLDESQQDAYKKIYYCIKTCMSSIMVEAKDLNEVEKIYYSVIDDHPEFYYVLSSFKYLEGKEYTVFPEYTYSREEIKSISENIGNKTKNIIMNVNKLDDITKIKTIYNYIIEMTEYKRNSDDQNMKSVFLENESVCAGYARAYQYLLNEVGIDAVYMGGKSKENNEGHAWVMISLDDNYYYSDPTWGDVVVEGMEHSCSAYFLMSSDEMLKRYIPDGKYEISSLDGYDYFKSVGCFMEKYDENIVDKAVKLGLSNGSGVAEIKCADKNVFDRLKKEIEINYLGYRVLKENNCFSGKSKYLCDENTLMVELYY